MEDLHVHVTVCIPTCNRGAQVAAALESLAANTYTDFDVIVIDQSVDALTEEAVAPVVAADRRVTYLRSATQGTSAARNEGIARACGDVIAFLDDDCRASATWLATIVARFQELPAVGQLCGAVIATAHDPMAGYVLTTQMRRPRLVRSPWLKWREGGIGANMAFRRETLGLVGPFDELLCPGGALYSAQDRDMTYRTLRAGSCVLDDPAISVRHDGIRAWNDGRMRMRRVGIGIGAAWMKHLRLLDLAILPTLVLDGIRCVNWSRLLTLQGRSGVATLLYYCRGLTRSFAFPIDRRWRIYRQRDVQPTHKQ
jgi:glycosyltransferase involved in cell wall biosynthesis